MKKIILFVLASFFLLEAQAKANFLCGYKDYFHLSDRIHPAVTIISANANQDLYLQVISPRSFEIRDTPNCETGYAHVTVGYDNFHWCVLDIKDGPYMNHPTITATCNGMQYKNLSYDGFNSYSYTINLELRS